MHPFRFGVVLESVQDPDVLRETARRAEASGYSTILIRDHLIAEPFGPQLGPIATIATVAAHTTSLRIGTLVIDNDFRHPAILAKEAATLDLLSGGRLELGLGAGWLADEYRQSGIPFDAPGTRIARLGESTAILKQLLAGGPVSFSGDFYHLDGLESFPCPVQQPHPPILLAGGAKRMLSLAGREGDIVNVLTTSVASGKAVDSVEERTFDRVAKKVGWIRDAAGDRFPSIELSLFPTVIVSENRIDAAEKLAAERGWNGVSPEVVLDMPAVFIGTIDEIVESFVARRTRLGFSYFVISDARLDLTAPIVARLAGH